VLIVVVVAVVASVVGNVFVVYKLGVYSIQGQAFNLVKGHCGSLSAVIASIGLVTAFKASLVLKEDIPLFASSTKSNRAFSSPVRSALALWGTITRRPSSRSLAGVSLSLSLLCGWGRVTVNLLLIEIAVASAVQEGRECLTTNGSGGSSSSKARAHILTCVSYYLLIRLLEDSINL